MARLHELIAGHADAPAEVVVGIETDPLSSREHVLLSNLILFTFGSALVIAALACVGVAAPAVCTLTTPSRAIVMVCAPSGMLMPGCST